MNITPTTKSEILKTIHSMKRRAAPGIDGIPTKIVQSCANLIALPLENIINACFFYGVFPTDIKMAKVTPIPKKGKKDDSNNYRPIAVLSIFSKIIEKLFLDRLTLHLETNNILSDNQHGFRKNKSTTTATFSLLNPVYKALERKDMAICTFYDYTKAFDSLEHAIIYEKCRRYGIKDEALKFIISFLTHRSQVVAYKYATENELKTAIFNSLPVEIGVPQGSTLSPTLFAIAANDLTDTVKEGTTTQFADDTSNTISGTTLGDVETKAKAAAVQVADYSYDSKLILNTEKTTFLHMDQHLNKESPNISIGLQTIQESTHTRFLGIEISNNLDWFHHTDHLCKVLNKGIFLLRQLSHKLTTDALKLAYYANIHSHIQFGIIFWGESRHAKRIFSLQKAALKAMFRLKINESCAPTFRSEGILTLPCIYILEAASFVKNNPTKFTLNSDIHTHNTRLKNNYRPPKKTKGLEYPLASIYNNLPQNIKGIECPKTFKRALKKLLLQHQFYKISDFFQFKF